LSNILKIAFEKYHGHPRVQVPSDEIIEQVFQKTLEKGFNVILEEGVAENRAGEALLFLRERLEFYLSDVCKFNYDVINAVLDCGWNDVVDSVLRSKAVAKVIGSEDFDAIAASVKRIKNILRQAVEAGKWNSAACSSVPADNDAERILAERTAELATNTAALCHEKKYDEALAALATIRRPLDEFFDKVMVMVDDEAVRTSRLTLLQSVAAMFQTIADFSEVVTTGKAS
jgi:glycyl-tRNA synthetase beta chain